MVQQRQNASPCCTRTGMPGALHLRGHHPGAQPGDARRCDFNSQTTHRPGTRTPHDTRKVKTEDAPRDCDRRPIHTSHKDVAAVLDNQVNTVQVRQHHGPRSWSTASEETLKSASSGVCTT
eukprot:scaffold106555_cov33-Tisochrysis_lutea.AAC.5